MKDKNTSLLNKEINFDQEDMDNNNNIDIDDIDMSEEDVFIPAKLKSYSGNYDYDDSTKIYLDQISKFKLLNFEEEKELSRRIQKGDEAALQKLINSNLRLVVKIGKPFQSKTYSLIDIIQDGNLGLIKAAKNYDFRKNVRFSTYASWWIKQTIIRSLAVKKYFIKLPHRKEDKLKKIRKYISAYIQKNKTLPNMQELSLAVNIPLAEIKSILQASNPVMSFEKCYNDDENLALKDLIGDNSFRPDTLYTEEELRGQLLVILGTLFPKERMILYYRFGFDQKGKKFTLKKMGSLLGMSPETVRQIEVKALRKLKTNFSYLKDYITN